MGKLTIKEESSNPQTPVSGNRTMYPKQDGWYEINDSGVVKNLFSDKVFGLNYIGQSSSGQDTNTLNSFKTYLGLSYPSGIATNGYKYEIEFHALTRYSTSGRNHICRIALDGNTIEEEISIEHKDTGSDIRFPIGYKYIIDGNQLNGNGGFIDFDYRAQQNGDTARVYSCTLTFKRVI